MKSSKAPTKKKKLAGDEPDYCFRTVKNLLNFRLTVSAMENICVSPGTDSRGKPTVELCGTVNFEPTRKFAEETARLAECIRNGSHKLVNRIVLIAVTGDDTGPEDVMCCCPSGGCEAIQGACPPCE